MLVAVPLLLASIVAFGIGRAIASPTVTIGKTKVIGTSLPQIGVDLFGGLPFAKALRFAPPELVTKLDGPTFDATQISVACAQNLPPGLPPVNTMSEDCLHLDIYRPSGMSSHAHLPVMVWIFGGGFMDGTSGFYNGSAVIVEHSIARGTPIIVVPLNYRLGALGFPVGSEAAKNGALNLGLKDQLAALRWIQANIGHFGGDRTKVTVAGQSAGAVSIANFFFNSDLETLARGVILESGSQSTTSFFTPKQQDDLWHAFSERVSGCKSETPCKTFACLKTAPVEEILEAALSVNNESPLGFAFRPVIDGPNGVIPDLPSRLIAQGKFARIPFISGTNLDEGTIVTPPTVSSKQGVINFVANDSNSIANNETILPERLLAFTTQLVDLYSTDPADGSPFGTGNDTFGLSPFYKVGAAVIGDVLFQALRRAWISAATKRGVKTFGYEFTDPQPGSGAFGVFHASEVFYVFGNIFSTPAPAASKQLANIMMDYWISFITSLDPNDGHGNARAVWPQYQTHDPHLLQLNSLNLTVIPDTYRQTQFDFINQNPEILGH